MARRKTAAQRRREQIEQTAAAYALAGAGVAWLGWRHPLLLGLTLGALGLATLVAALLVIFAHRLANPWRHYVTPAPAPARSGRPRGQAKRPRPASASRRPAAASQSRPRTRRAKFNQDGSVNAASVRTADGGIDRDAVIALLREHGAADKLGRTVPPPGSGS